MLISIQPLSHSQYSIAVYLCLMISNLVKKTLICWLSKQKMLIRWMHLFSITAYFIINKNQIWFHDMIYCKMHFQSYLEIVRNIKFLVRTFPLQLVEENKWFHGRMICKKKIELLKIAKKIIIYVMWLPFSENTFFKVLL